VWIAQGAPAAKWNEKNHFQPSFEAQRWRNALLRDTSDKLTPAGEAFASLPDTGMWDGGVWGMHELFAGLPSNPEKAEAQIRNHAATALHDLAVLFFAPFSRQVWDEYNTSGGLNRELDADLAMLAWEKIRKGPTQDFNRAAKEFYRFFGLEDSAALPLWKDLIKESWAAAMATLGTTRPKDSLPFVSVTDLTQAMEGIAREVAKLDGFDVTLRSLPIDQQRPLVTAKHWVVPVRDWARNDDWQSTDGSIQGSHDEEGLVRAAYVEAGLTSGLYDEKGLLKEGVLDPDCVESREWNLSAGQFKPFDFTELRTDKSVKDLIGDLRMTEQQIIESLDRLIMMVEGHE
jgi:type I restriction enzyme M protein